MTAPVVRHWRVEARKVVTARPTPWCACACGCDYRLHGYAPDEPRCGACLDHCTPEAVTP